MGEGPSVITQQGIIMWDPQGQQGPIYTASPIMTIEDNLKGPTVIDNRNDDPVPVVPIAP